MASDYRASGRRGFPRKSHPGTEREGGVLYARRRSRQSRPLLVIGVAHVTGGGQRMSITRFVFSSMRAASAARSTTVVEGLHTIAGPAMTLPG